VKVAVTGASGFIGRSLKAALIATGHEALPLDLRIARFTGADAVVHLAAIAHRSATREELRRVNVDLARDIGEACAAHGAALVFLSSVKVHGEESAEPFTERSAIAPRDLYGESKAHAEEALRAIPGLRLAILRPPLVYGPCVKANFLALLKAIARGVPLPLASVRNRRSFVYVGNLVDAVLHCLGHAGTFLISDGESRSTAQLCRDLGVALGRPARLFPFPEAWLPAKLSASLEVDDSAIRRELQWRPPYSIDEGLSATARWYRAR
jgi:nucleoside-diphosphate-sugar epimerase